MDPPVYQVGYTIWLDATLKNRTGDPTDGDPGTLRLRIYRGAVRGSGVLMEVQEADIGHPGSGMREYAWVPTYTGDILVEWEDALDGKPRGKRQTYKIVEVA